MTAEDVAALVKRDIESGDFENWHGITHASIDALLVTPILESYEDGLDASRVQEYWTILHEDAAGREGYTIFYSEDDGMFGLAVAGRNAKYAIVGLYGTLRETLTAM
jgi:hypothetical protein